MKKMKAKSFKSKKNSLKNLQMKD